MPVDVLIGKPNSKPQLLQVVEVFLSRHNLTDYSVNDKAHIEDCGTNPDLELHD